MGTHLNIDSDHCILTTTYNTKHQITNPKYITIRNNKLLTKNKLQKYVTNSIPLQEVFSMTDPNEIAETIQIELNAIMNTIAPPKDIQFKKDFTPYFDSQIIEQIDKMNVLLQTAIHSQEFDDWRQYKHN